MQFTAIPFADDGDIPNNRFPLIVYEGAIDPSAGDPAVAFEAIFAANGWGNGWRNGIYPFHHYHSTAHEVLGIAKGSARVQMGGPHGRELTVAAGSALLIPAGVGHKRLSSEAGLLVIGAYPRGQSPDLMREGEANAHAIRDRIEAVPFPGTDPITGDTGPMWEAWR